MKIVYFPRIFINNKFVTDILIKNLLPSSDAVTGQVIRWTNKTVSKIINVDCATERVLDSEYLFKGSYEPSGILSVKLITSDYTQCVAIVRDKKTLTNILTIQPLYLNKIKDVVNIQEAETVKSFSRTVLYPYYNYCGKESCSSLKHNYIEIINLVAASVYYEYLGSEDRKLSLGDCTPPVGSCDGHPAGSHSNHRAFDMNYYTRKTNITQYRPETTNYELTSIWDTNYGWGEKLLTEIFDWERNYKFFKGLHAIIPESVFHINTTIFNHMIENIRSKYSMDDVYEFSKYIYNDNNQTWNHNLHAHVDLGLHADNLNLDYPLIKSFATFKPLLIDGVIDASSEDTVYLQSLVISTYNNYINSQTVETTPEVIEDDIIDTTPPVLDPVDIEEPIIENNPPTIEENTTVNNEINNEEAHLNIFQKIIRFFKRILGIH